jgi:AcrR family transcriptional regulator
MSEAGEVRDELGTAPRRERCDALENRRKLLVAAKQLFAAQGLDQTDMYEVARAAGLGQGTLYRHFAHKGELCQALVRDDLDAFMARVDEKARRDAGPDSALSALDGLIADQLALLEKHLPLLAASEAAGGPPGPKGPRSPWRQWLREHVTRLLSAAVERGEVDPDVDVQYVADALLAILSPRQVGYQRRELGYDLDRIIAGTRSLFVEGLRLRRVGGPGVGGPGAGEPSEAHAAEQTHRSNESRD